MERAVRSLEAGGFVLYRTAFEGVLAEGLIACGRLGQADAVVSAALARCQASGEAWCVPELMRIGAVALAGSNLLTEAVGVLADGLRIARAQGALAWELRLASSFVEVEDSARARESLLEVLSQVQEGFGTSDYLRAVAKLG